MQEEAIASPDLAEHISKFEEQGDPSKWRNKVVLVMVGLPARG